MNPIQLQLTPFNDSSLCPNRLLNRMARFCETASPQPCLVA